MTVSAVVSALNASGLSDLVVADRLAVSPDTVKRWREGRTRPRPDDEGRLRSLAAEHGFFSESQVAIGAVEGRLDSALRDVREALHRRGRMSSRNEALDEIARLIFAHSASIQSGGDGISERLAREGNPAAALREFVSEMKRHLPRSLAYQLSPDDFELQMDSREDDLAVEVIEAFQYMRPDENLFAGRGDLAGHDLINHAFGRFIADSFTDEKELGQYLTPTEVVTFMVALAISELSETARRYLSSPCTFDRFGYVLDPSCGVGSFLAEFVRQGHRELAPQDSEWATHAARSLVVGIDKSERMIRLALANLTTFGSDAARLHLANGLARAGMDGEVADNLTGKVGLILTNPPFGASFPHHSVHNYRIASQWASRKPRSLDSELLFLERYVDWLMPGGQLLAVVPDSILTNKGIFADLRNGLKAEVDIRTIVSLPPNTFAAAGTSTKTSVLHLVKDKSSRSATRFAICNDIGYSVTTRGSQRRKIHRSTGELPQILSGLKRDGKSDVVHSVLCVGDQARWDAGYHASLSKDLSQDLSVESGAIAVSDVAILSTDRVDPRRSGGGTFEYIEISDIDGSSLSVTSKSVLSNQAASRARRSVKAGDVLVSTVRPERGAIGVVPESLDGAVCTTGLAVLRPYSIDPYVLAACLRSDFVTQQLMRNNIGIAYPAIDPECLQATVLPILKQDIHLADTAADNLRASWQRYDTSKRDFFNTVGRLFVDARLH